MESDAIDVYARAHCDPSTVECVWNLIRGYGCDLVVDEKAYGGRADGGLRPGPVIWLRPKLDGVRSRDVALRCLAVLHLRNEGHSETQAWLLSRRLGAALVAPQPAFQRLWPNIPTVTSEILDRIVLTSAMFRASPGCVALRLGEALPYSVALVSQKTVHRRGEGWPVLDAAMRRLTAQPRPGVVSVPIDACRRTLLTRMSA